MSTETDDATVPSTTATLAPWQAGLAGGLLGGLVFGAMVSTMMTPVIENAMPGMYGIAGPAGGVGWVVHMSHSAVLGVAFAALAATTPLGERLDGLGPTLVAGVAYGAVLWAILAVLVMPVWVGAMTPAEPPLPNVNVQSLVGHLVYGGLLGVGYAALGE